MYGRINNVKRTLATILGIVLLFAVTNPLQAMAADTRNSVPEYRVALTTKIWPSNDDEGILVIEPEDYTAEEVAVLKDSGYKVLGYLSVGSVSDERGYYHSLKPYTLGDLEDWPHEKYLDISCEGAQNWLIARGEELIEDMGFDGLWLDNIDVYEEYPSDGMYDGITNIIDALDPKGYIMVNGGVRYMVRALENGDTSVDGITQEEVFSLVTDYDGKGEFGRQEADQRAEYLEYISAALDAGMDAFLLEYTRDADVKNDIYSYCDEVGAGYYISDDVDL